MYDSIINALRDVLNFFLPDKSKYISFLEGDFSAVVVANTPGLMTQTSLRGK